eukprot:TRINITY_DN1627_c4_g1_i1.p4 TRINITY_DN1627_c4_g1~~TRINITY_DN1627_c4_g1_i1.p4  ORF type:complete len:105 (-),score=22.24 TRINITY_DN1627_c4_g1_i1:300-614(-)
MSRFVSKFNTFLPYFNFVVAGGALVFQTTVLYPWHIELERDFMQFKTDQHNRMEHRSNQNGKKFAHIEHTLSNIAHKDSVIHHHIVRPHASRAAAPGPSFASAR